MNSQRPQKLSQLVCYCNNIPKEEIEAAIRRGCHTLNQIFDATTAGVGPCGGSCRSSIARMLDCYLQTGEFPENPRPVQKRRR